MEQLSIDGQLRPPLLNDYDRRWRRVIFDAPDQHRLSAHRRFVRALRGVDRRRRPFDRADQGQQQNWQAAFAFDVPLPEHLILDGDMDGYTIHVELQLVEFDSFRLLNSGFRWIRPPDPYGG